MSFHWLEKYSYVQEGIPVELTFQLEEWYYRHFIPVSGTV
jgi:hypothetical protein